MAGRSSLQQLSDEERERFRERLRKVVQTIGTQKEAAEIADVSLGQLKNYLSGRSAPPATVVSRLGTKAGFSIEWLISGVGPEILQGGGRLTPKNDEQEEIRANAVILATRLRELLNFLEQGLSEIYGKLSESAEEDVLDPLLDLIAPDQQTPADWREKAALALESHRGAHRLFGGQ